MIKRFLAAAAVAVMGLVSLQSALATPSGVSSVGALGSNDFIDWGVLGVAGTPIPNPYTGTSVGGLGYTVSQGQNNFMRLNQGDGWLGNFAPGATLLWTNGSNGPMSISFASGIYGAGAQIQATYLGAFGARLEAFDAGSTSLGVFTLDGNSIALGDNTAIFIGMLSNTAEIWRMTFSLDSAAGEPMNFAIGNVALATTAPIPEPEIYAMMLAGLGMLGVLTRRKKLQAAALVMR